MRRVRSQFNRGVSAGIGSIDDETPACTQVFGGQGELNVTVVGIEDHDAE